MNFIPIDVANTEPSAGGGGIPEGWYLFRMDDATTVRPTQDGQKQRRTYKVTIMMGPGPSQELAGKSWTDSIPEGEQTWASRHMELFVACLGSKEAVRAAAQQAGGYFPAEALHGRYYIAQLVKSDRYTNVVQRIAYTQENWQKNAVEAQAQNAGLLLQQPGAMPAAPPSMPVPATAPPAFAAPPAAAPPAAAPPFPNAAPPPFPGMPAAPTAAPAWAPPTGGVPTPPPPPGHPAVR